MCLCLSNHDEILIFLLTRWSRAWKFAGDTWLITEETVDSSFRMKYLKWLMKIGDKANGNWTLCTERVFLFKSEMSVDSRPSNRTNVTSRTKHVAFTPTWRVGAGELKKKIFLLLLGPLVSFFHSYSINEQYVDLIKVQVLTRLA